MRRYGAALLLAGVLASCAGPRPQAPGEAAVTPPAEWRDGAVAGTASVDPAWWKGFGDPVLGDIVRQALAHNDDLAIAAGRVEEARAQFRLARAQQRPDLDGMVAGGPQRALNAFGIGTDQTVGEAELSVSYDLDLFGRLRNATAAARAALLATEAARDDLRLAVASSAAGGYLTLRALDARLLVLRDTLAARADSLKFARRRAESGYAPRLDQAQAEADYRATEQLIPVAELAIRKQEDGLSILLGRPPGAIARGHVLAAISPPTIAPMLPAALIRRRPDIAQAEDQLVAADAQLDAVRAAFLPSIQLSAVGGYVASTLIPDPVSIFSLGSSILAPLLDGGRLRARQSAQAARRDQAAFGYRRVVLDAFREVEDAMAETRRYGEQERALTQQRDALAEALRIATNRYKAGYSPYLEQLDAQRGLLSAELALVQTRADCLTSAVRLYQALGGGWGAAPPVESDAKGSAAKGL